MGGTLGPLDLSLEKGEVFPDIPGELGALANVRLGTLFQALWKLEPGVEVGDLLADPGVGRLQDPVADVGGETALAQLPEKKILFHDKNINWTFLHDF